MRKSILAGILAAVLGAGAATAAPPVAADQAALEKLAADNDAAWTRKDWATITRQYLASGTLRVSPSNDVRVGREAIAFFFQTSFARRPDGFRHVTRIDHIEMVSPDIALADGYVRVERAEGSEWALVREFSSSSLLMRDVDGWKLHSVRAHPLPSQSTGS